MAELPEQVDAVVVGAGIAGLVAAAFLAEAGRSTLLLEANHQVGGLMAGIRRKGFVFDAGDQSFEDAGMLFPILEQLGIDPSESLHRASHRFVGPGFDYRPTSLDAAQAGTHSAVPQEADGVRALFDRLRRLEAAQQEMREGIYPPALPHDQWPAALRRFLRWQLAHGRVFGRAGEIRYGQVVDELIADPGTRRILGRAGYRDQSLLMAAGLWYSWCHDYWYPRGGMQAFVERLADVARERGADIRLRSPVARVLAKGRRVAGVALADGREIRADRVVWAADARTLYRSALPEEHRGGARAKRVLEAPPSDTMVALYLGLDMPPGELRDHLGATHLFHFHDDELARVEDRLDDPDVHGDVWLQWNAPILHGEEFAPPGQSAVVLQAFSDIRWMGRWGTEEGDRPRYEVLKARVIDQMVATAERWIPGLSRRVVYRDLGSPLAVERFTGNADGATAGWSYAPGGKPFRAPGIGPGTPLSGLWQGGQWAIWPGGVPFAAMSGRLAAELALDGWSGHLWRLLTGRHRGRG